MTEDLDDSGSGWFGSLSKLTTKFGAAVGSALLVGAFNFFSAESGDKAQEEETGAALAEQYQLVLDLLVDDTRALRLMAYEHRYELREMEARLAELEGSQ